MCIVLADLFGVFTLFSFLFDTLLTNKQTSVSISHDNQREKFEYVIAVKTQ